MNQNNPSGISFIETSTPGAYVFFDTVVNDHLGPVVHDRITALAEANKLFGLSDVIKDLYRQIMQRFDTIRSATGTEPVSELRYTRSGFSGTMVTTTGAFVSGSRNRHSANDRIDELLEQGYISKTAADRLRREANWVFDLIRDLRPSFKILSYQFIRCEGVPRGIFINADGHPIVDPIRVKSLAMKALKEIAMNDALSEHQLEDLRSEIENVYMSIKKEAHPSPYSIVRTKDGRNGTIACTQAPTPEDPIPNLTEARNVIQAGVDKCVIDESEASALLRQAEEVFGEIMATRTVYFLRNRYGPGGEFTGWDGKPFVTDQLSWQTFRHADDATMAAMKLEKLYGREQVNMLLDDINAVFARIERKQTEVGMFTLDELLKALASPPREVPPPPYPQ